MPAALERHSLRLTGNISHLRAANPDLCSLGTHTQDWEPLDDWDRITTTRQDAAGSACGSEREAPRRGVPGFYGRNVGSTATSGTGSADRSSKMRAEVWRNQDSQGEQFEPLL